MNREQTQKLIDKMREKIAVLEAFHITDPPKEEDAPIS